MSKKSAPDEFSFFKDKLIDSAATPEKPAAPTPLDPTVPAVKTKTLPFDPSLKDKIIVIDDSPTILTVTSGILKTFSYAAIAFREPEVALAELTQMPAEELADIKAIFCDFEMKKMNGLEFLKAIRAKSQFATIPFILMTGSSDRTLVQSARAMKVNGYMLKPISTNLIKTTLDNLFPKRSAEQVEVKRAK